MSFPSHLKPIGPLAYRGKKGCTSATCTRLNVRAFLAGEEEACFGWHCSYCDEPCSSMGHGCDAAKAVLGEARRQAGIPDA